MPSVNLNHVKEKISCFIWQNEWKGADLSMLEISNYIIENADKTPLSADYFYLGCIFSTLISGILALTEMFFFEIDSIPKDLANMPSDLSADFVPGIRKKRMLLIGYGAVFLWRFSHDVFTACSRDQIWAKNFWSKTVGPGVFTKYRASHQNYTDPFCLNLIENRTPLNIIFL